ncbi:trypsin-like serine protease [Streptomyces sp. NPDC058441]|uniref:trypsin-like serine protease n=1 Tax=Streptomyces sp. NPDC058441 TaxID=3346502 RepID=UPI0036534CD8
MATLLESLRRSHPQELASLDSLTQQVKGIGEYAPGWPDSVSETHAGKIIGYGMTPLAGQIHPALLVEIDLNEVRVKLPGVNVTDQSDEVMRDLAAVQAELPGDVAIIGLPRPEEQALIGDAMHCGAGLATCGAPVVTKEGVGFITAGHAAPFVGAAAFDVGANLIGYVSFTNSCRSVNPWEATADVAVVEFENDDYRQQYAASDVALGTATETDVVTAEGAITRGMSSHLLTVGAKILGPSEAGGNWDEAMITIRDISAKGDSGAAVFNQRQELIGHIVGGRRGAYSVAQDITYQLSFCGLSVD